jgi:mRNA interferase RelE/StbE
VTWKVSYTRSAAKAIRKLDSPTRARLRAAIDHLAREPDRGKALRLTLQGLRSWRTGDWRIVYQVVEQTVEILVVAVGHRREVYSRVRDLLK